MSVRREDTAEQLDRTGSRKLEDDGDTSPRGQKVLRRAGSTDVAMEETSEASGGSRSGMEGSSTARPAPNTALKAEVIAGVAGLYATPPEASQAGPAAAAAAASAAHGPSRAELKECLLELLPELDLDVVTLEQCNGAMIREMLEQRFGVTPGSLKPWRAFINQEALAYLGAEQGRAEPETPRKKSLCPPGISGSVYNWGQLLIVAVHKEEAQLGKVLTFLQYCTTKCTEDLGGRDMFGVAEEWTSCLLRRRMAPAERQHLQQINKQLQQRDPAGIQRFVDLFDPNEIPASPARSGCVYGICPLGVEQPDRPPIDVSIEDNTDEELVAAVDQLVGEVAVMEAEAGGSYFGSAASASAEKAQPQDELDPARWQADHRVLAHCAAVMSNTAPKRRMQVEGPVWSHYKSKSDLTPDQQAAEYIADTRGRTRVVVRTRTPVEARAMELVGLCCRPHPQRWQNTSNRALTYGFGDPDFGRWRWPQSASADAGHQPSTPHGEAVALGHLRNRGSMVMTGASGPGAYADALFATDVQLGVRVYSRGQGQRRHVALASAVQEHAFELAASGEPMSPAWAAVAAAPFEKLQGALRGYLNHKAHQPRR